MNNSFFVLRKNSLVFHSKSQGVIFILGGISNYNGLLSVLIKKTKDQDYLKYKEDAFVFQKLIDRDLKVKDCALFRR